MLRQLPPKRALWPPHCFTLPLDISVPIYSNTPQRLANIHGAWKIFGIPKKRSRRLLMDDDRSQNQDENAGVIVATSRLSLRKMSWKNINERLRETAPVSGHERLRAMLKQSATRALRRCHCMPSPISLEPSVSHPRIQSHTRHAASRLTQGPS